MQNGNHILSKDVLIITGGNGFLGKHLIQNLPFYLQNSQYYANPGKRRQDSNPYKNENLLSNEKPSKQKSHQPLQNNTIGVSKTNNFNDIHEHSHHVTWANEIAEIRLLDISFAEEYSESHVTIMDKWNIPIKCYRTDILDAEKLSKVFEGGTVVLHCASIIIHPSLKYLRKVNYIGTLNVIEACRENGIPTLIYTSSVDVMVGFGLRTSLKPLPLFPYPRVHLFPSYGGSKMEAERAILAANNETLKDGSGNWLKTVALRPSAIYGPEDSYFITESIRIGLKGVEPYIWWNWGGESKQRIPNRFPKLNIGGGMFQGTYIGNIAWAHFKALEAMKIGNPNIAGKAFYISDDTPICSIYDFVTPFFEAHKIKMYPRYIPTIFVWAMGKAFQAFFTIFPCLQGFFPVTLSSLLYLYSTHIISYQRSKDVFGYKPIYTPQEALDKSIEYYSKVTLPSK